MDKLFKIILIAFAFFRTFFRGKMNPAAIRKLKQKVDEVTNEQAKVLDTKPFDYGRYHSLDAELVRLNKEIERLQTK